MLAEYLHIREKQRFKAAYADLNYGTLRRLSDLKFFGSARKNLLVCREGDVKYIRRESIQGGNGAMSYRW